MITTRKESINALNNVISGVSSADNDRADTRLTLARNEFFEFCNLMAPRFYKRDRQFLIDMCDAMQNFYESKDENILIINLPPRHGKSRTAQLFVEWVLGHDQEAKIMTGSYNESLSETFSKGVRNAISEIKADRNITVYSDVFPDVAIKQGDAAMKRWSLEGGYNNYLATSPTGTATGFGASMLIIDDLIKNAMEANNDSVLEKHWSWFTDTMLSRLEEKGKIVIIMTRWSSKDLAGRALEYYKEMNTPVRHICMKAMQDDGSMLCPEILSERSYKNKVAIMGDEIASANYQQIPIDIRGRLYTKFKTYDTIPRDEHGRSLFRGIMAYCDTADEGADYLCSIIYGVYDMEAYVLDVVYTQEPMEKTEKLVAHQFDEYLVNKAKIESNNGGRGFARSVERILKQKYHTNRTKVKWFHQGQNKVARILTNASWVMDHVYYPVNWKHRWPEYYKAMNAFQREGKNAHDDAPDATTGIAENMEHRGIRTFRKH